MKYINIGFFPTGKTSNSYTQNLIKILNKIGAVSEISYSVLFWRRYDIVFLNWMESSLIDKNGHISYAGVLKYFLKIIILKIKSKKIVYILHNIYPHGTNKDSIRSVVAVMRIALFFCDKVVVHSGDGRFSDYEYLPHPLYKFTENYKQEVIYKNYYLIFGRIVRYKKIENTINKIPKDIKIIVCGKCEDRDYFDYLMEMYGGRVIFITENVSDDYAMILHKNSKGAIVCHSDDEMIVSGSIIFSISCNTKVFVNNMPYAEWLERCIGISLVKNFSCISDLIAGLTENKEYDPQDINVTDHFSDSAILFKINKLIE